VIVDDNESFLNEARDLLEREGIDVVGVATSGSEAREAIARLQPELTLVDIDLQDESGFDLVRTLADRPVGSTSSVNLISTHAETDFADLIAASPAAGFVSKVELSARAIHEALGNDPFRPEG
jgi:DNA-binding NarL/FixJ family response regulator